MAENTMADQIAEMLDDTGDDNSPLIPVDANEPVDQNPTPEPDAKPAADVNPDGNEPAEEPVEGKGEGESESELLVDNNAEPVEGEDPPKANNEPEPEPNAEPSKSELELLQEKNASLVELIEKLSKGTPVPLSEPAPVPDKAPDVPAAVPTPPVALQDYLKNLDYDAAMETKESFIEFFTTAMGIVQDSVKDQTINSVTPMLNDQVSRATTMERVGRQFYTDNPELAAVKGYVSTVAAEISGANPELSIGDVLEQAATTVKTTLGIVAVPATPTNTPTPAKPKAKPSLGGGSGGGKVTNPAKPTGLQAELDDFDADDF